MQHRGMQQIANLCLMLRSRNQEKLEGLRFALCVYPSPCRVDMESHFNRIRLKGQATKVFFKDEEHSNRHHSPANTEMYRPLALGRC